MAAPTSSAPLHANGSPATPADMHNLRCELTEASLQNQYLIQEVETREEERWQLLHVLTRKDEQLREQEKVNERQRAVLQSVRDAASHYRVLCTLRAWNDVVHRSMSQRTLAQAKRRLTTSLLKQVCRVIFVGVRQAAKRQTKAALHALWLNAASKDLDVLMDGGEAAPLTPPRRHSPQRSWQKALWSNSPYSTKSPQGRASPSRASEVSTSMPMSSPRYTRASGVPSPATVAGSASLNGNPGTDLAAAVTRVQRRHLGQAFRCFHQQSTRFSEMSRHLNSEGRGSASSSAVPSASAALNDAEGPQDLIGILRARCSELEGLALKKSAAEAVLRQKICELEELSATESAESAQAKQAEKRACQELSELKAKCLSEHEADEALRLSVAACEADLRRCREKETIAVQRQAEVERRLLDTQETYSMTEAQLEKEAKWREEAERRIVKMVSRGEALERERMRLLNWQSQSRQQQLANSEECEALQRLVRQEEQEITRTERRIRALEEQNSELTGNLQKAERQHLAQVDFHKAEKVTLLQELAELRAEMLTASSAKWSSEERAAEAARGETLQALTRERSIWASELSKLNSEFEDVKARLRAAQRHEEAEALAVERAASAGDARLKEEAREGARSLAAARRELAEEAATCQQLKLTLTKEISQARALEEELASQQQRRSLHSRTEPKLQLQQQQPLHREGWRPPSREAVQSLPAPTMSKCRNPEAAIVATIQAAPSSLPPPAAADASQMDELDAYARLVKHLQAEIQWEKDERETSQRSLDSMRSSYGLLLERTHGMPGQAKTSVASVPSAVLPIS
mmetsp:Transcript_57750/g.137462  ORF Transcript_57750/g.137462 Transcript_57750/m.137462 type:complete len:811 (-) Transcript_57750:123-2555(-)